MRREIPLNNVKHDYICVLKEFIDNLKDKLSDELVMVYLTGSYARGDATDSSDLDVFCICRNMNQHILETVGICANSTSIPYNVLEINTQSMSVKEYKNKFFENWSEVAVTELNSVLLYGEEIIKPNNIKETIENTYKKSLADVIMSIRHYICVNEPIEKLTHDKIKMWILKPLMFALRQERFCTTGIYPLTNQELLESYCDENRMLVEYYLDKNIFDRDIAENHKKVLNNIHECLVKLIEK